MSNVVCKATCRDCNHCYVGKTKRRLHDRKTEHYKALSNRYSKSVLADHVRSTGHNKEPTSLISFCHNSIKEKEKEDHFHILAKGVPIYIVYV